MTEFKPGDEVFGERSRAFAEYVLGKEEHFAHKPASLTFEQAATLGCAALTALQGLRDKAQVKPGQKVLINGAGGGVGTFSVQIAKSLGADVTAVCDTHNVEMVRSIGADRVIDYSREDFTETKERYDVVFDNVGNRSLRRLRRILTPSGTLVFVGAPHFRFAAPLIRVLRGVIRSRFSEQKLLPFLATHSKDDLLVLKELVESGKRDAGHRPDVPAERGPRGDPLSRARARSGQGRHHRLRRLSASGSSSRLHRRRRRTRPGRREGLRPGSGRLRSTMSYAKASSQPPFREA